MGKPLSMDLRSRALAAVDEGMSCRAAAQRFGVAAATVIRWYDQWRSTGSYAAKAQGRDTRSRRIEIRCWRCTKHGATSRWKNCAASWPRRA